MATHAPFSVALRKARDPKKTPAEPSERRRGSDSNKPGSAKDAKGGIDLSASTVQSLKNKVKEHNEKSSKKVTLAQLKAVYRRGSGAFSTSHHPRANRHSWSMGRVNSFLRRLKGGDGHSQDDDLIKKGQDSYSVPAGVRAAAKRGLELRKKQSASGKAGLSTREAGKQGIGSGVARASNLISGRVSKQTIKRMHAYFSRHQGNYKLDAGKKPHEDKGYVAGLLWGGEAGRSFAAKMVRRFKAEEAKKSRDDFSGDPMQKGKSYAVGTIRTRKDGSKYKKLRNGEWKQVSSAKKPAKKRKKRRTTSKKTQAQKPARKMPRKGTFEALRLDPRVRIVERMGEYDDYAQYGPKGREVIEVWLAPTHHDGFGSKSLRATSIRELAKFVEHSHPVKHYKELEEHYFDETDERWRSYVEAHKEEHKRRMDEYMSAAKSHDDFSEDPMIKGRKPMPTGTVVTRKDGSKWKKLRNGEWKRTAGPTKAKKKRATKKKKRATKKRAPKFPTLDVYKKLYDVWQNTGGTMTSSQKSGFRRKLRNLARKTNPKNFQAQMYLDVMAMRSGTDLHGIIDVKARPKRVGSRKASESKTKPKTARKLTKIGRMAHTLDPMGDMHESKAFRREVSAWVNQGFTPGEAKSWRDVGLTKPTKVKALKRLGVAPTDLMGRREAEEYNRGAIGADQLLGRTTRRRRGRHEGELIQTLKEKKGLKVPKKPAPKARGMEIERKKRAERKKNLEEGVSTIADVNKVFAKVKKRAKKGDKLVFAGEYGKYQEDNKKAYYFIDVHEPSGTIQLGTSRKKVMGTKHAHEAQTHEYTPSGQIRPWKVGIRKRHTVTARNVFEVRVHKPKKSDPFQEAMGLIKKMRGAKKK